MGAILAALLAAGGGAATPASPGWNAKAPENTQILPSFTLATVEPVLSSVSARFQRSELDPAKPSLLVTFANGRKAIVQMSACDLTGASCKALSLQSSWTRIANAPADRTAKAIERFNQRYAFGKALLTADGRPLLQRYLTADYGFIRGNLAVNLLAFASQADRLATEVLAPLEAGKN